MVNYIAMLKMIRINREGNIMSRVAIINGPNLNLLGKREPLIYGDEDWTSIKKKVQKVSAQLKMDILFFQSNHEGDIVDFIQEQMEELDGIIINPAAFTKTGYSILDALTAQSIPYIEIHLTNIVSRGGWHSDSIFTENSIGLIMGLKGLGYELALMAMNHYLTAR